ncbi:MAG: hypothetical protein LBM98_02980 [Oscillospiraceae bacterium]|jgi:hypothetical protein|nr:hypothetical protein [Oscillospiraceae bacterium]
MEQLQLSPVEKNGDAFMNALKAGSLLAIRSKNDFLYCVLRNKLFHLFTHTPGSPGGGQKQFPEDEKYTAVIRNLSTLCDLAIAVNFNEKEMNLYNVMASAEEAILETFPGDDRDADATVDFMSYTEEDFSDEGNDIE